VESVVNRRVGTRISMWMRMHSGISKLLQATKDLAVENAAYVGNDSTCWTRTTI